MIFINELCDLKVNGTVITFADDTAVLFSGRTWDEAIEHGEIGLKKIKKWLDDNLLSLNVKKTKFITFSLTCVSQPENLNCLRVHTCGDGFLECDCGGIQRVNGLRYLGVHIDENLKWDEHILQLTKKVRKCLYIYKRIRNILDTKTIRSVYFALTQSLLMYGITAWGGCTDIALNPLERVQKCIIKVILRKPTRFSSDELFNIFKVLDVRQLFIKYVMCDFKKEIQTKTRSQQIRLTRTAVNINFQVPTIRTATGRRQSSYLGPKLFNLLPDTLKHLESWAIFRKSLDDHMKGLDRNYLKSFLE